MPVPEAWGQSERAKAEIWLEIEDGAGVWVGCEIAEDENTLAKTLVVEVDALGVVATGLGGEWLIGFSGTSVSVWTKTKIINYN